MAEERSGSGWSPQVVAAIVTALGSIIVAIIGVSGGFSRSEDKDSAGGEGRQQGGTPAPRRVRRIGRVGVDRRGPPPSTAMPDTMVGTGPDRDPCGGRPADGA